LEGQQTPKEVLLRNAELVPHQVGSRVYCVDLMFPHFV
jgi:hypothetical protein